MKTPISSVKRVDQGFAPASWESQKIICRKYGNNLTLDSHLP